MASSQGSGTTNGLSLFFSQWFNLFRPKLPVFLSPIYPIYLDSIHIAICKKLKTTIICLCVNFFILITVPDHQIVINILIMYKISPTLKVCGKLRRASIAPAGCSFIHGWLKVSPLEMSKEKPLARTREHEGIQHLKAFTISYKFKKIIIIFLKMFSSKPRNPYLQFLDH
jgi:hypothetical protein